VRESTGVEQWSGAIYASALRTGAAETFTDLVRELPLPGRLLSQIAPLLAVLRRVNQQLAYSDERIDAGGRAPSTSSNRPSSVRTRRWGPRCQRSFTPRPTPVVSSTRCWTS
jgi:hypothetical protein